jgi:hypothetical protein
MTSFLTDLRDLIELKKSGELTAKEFTDAKGLLLGDAEKEAENPYDQTANASNRPQDGNKKYRKRSAADWLARMNKDLKVASDDDDVDARKTRMLNLWQEVNAAFAPSGKSDGITAETINDALQRYYEPDGYFQYADFTKGGNILAGKWDVKSGQAAEILDLWTNCGEYHFDFAKAQMAAYDNTLFMDLGWYKIIGKNSKKPYENSNKVLVVFNDTITKMHHFDVYWENDPNDQEAESVIDLFKDEDFPAQIIKRKLKPDGPPQKISTY